MQDINISETLVQKKIQDLLANMTLKEKIGQLIQIEPCFLLEKINSNKFKYESVLDSAFIEMLVMDYHVGFLLFGGVSRVGNGLPSEWIEFITKVNETAQKTKLKIPLLVAADAVHGVNFMKNSTIYSHNLGLSATWNPKLAKEYTRVVGEELASIGFNCNFAPTVDVATDPRWGRDYETLGEDPYLASIFSTCLVKGFQERGDLTACGKHFIGYSASNTGMDRSPADISERALMETHIPPFDAAIKSGVLTMMISGGDVNGVPVPASKKIVTNLLRDKLGFKGITMSDWEDISRLNTRHKVAADKRQAIAKAFNAGVDMNMAVSDLETFDIMYDLVQQGEISIERINEAVTNVLFVKLKLGLFEKKSLDAEKANSLVGNNKSKEVARQLALESMTLLKNQNNLLPLSKDYKSILITGMAANSKRHLCGGWTLGWAGAKEEDIVNCNTILEEIKSTVSPNTKITYAANEDHIKELNISPEDYDVCIAIISEEPHAEWTGDSPDLSLDENEMRVLKASVHTGIPVVMVTIIGRPQNLSWAQENVPSILLTYLPGTEGARAISDTLFGDYNPGGRLSITFPKNASQIPLVYNSRINSKYEPLYPFGYGLSYTKFEYSMIQIPKEIKFGHGIEISVKVKNVGLLEGNEVVQVYFKDEYASVIRPLKELKAFEKIFLKPNEEKVLTFNIEGERLRILNEDLEFVEESRKIEVQIGSESGKFKISK
jgi:beta-glucosidase